MRTLEPISEAYSAAMPCQACFGPESPVARAYVNLPQPRFVGPAYASASPRIVVLMLNPGQGNDSQLSGNRELLTKLNSYKLGNSSLQDIFSFQRQHMAFWGKSFGRFTDFYAGATGKPIDELAFLNVALCATEENGYPPWMLEQCFQKHTSRLVEALDPSLLLLSGSKLLPFLRRLQVLLPQSRVEPMLHYAHRGGAAADQLEYQRVSAIVSAMGKAGA